jgi:hypothetical protein
VACASAADGRLMGSGSGPEPDEVPEPTPEQEAEAEENVKDWLKDQGYPSPDPKDQ